MNETFFIADTHFGHKKVIKFEKEHRPFKTIEEHDEELIKRWNDRVCKKDSVWVLGDFCFGKANLDIAGRLNGTKRLVLGNHDLYPAADYLKYFTRICGAVEYKGMLLTHVPVHESQFERYTHNIHGHLHSQNIMMSESFVAVDKNYKPIGLVSGKDRRYINVSCEQINCTPISFDEIINQLKE